MVDEALGLPRLALALLRQGIDTLCTLGEPRVAFWLLDPDDKHHVSIVEMAAKVREKP